MVTPLELGQKLVGSDALAQLIRFEAIAQKSAGYLDRAARQHHRDLTRIARLRNQVGLDAPRVPTEHELAHPIPDGWFAGRITKCPPLTNDHLLTGQMQLDSGAWIDWTASSFYVDYFEVLFTGVPVIVAGDLNGHSLRIHEIAAAPDAYWRDGDKDALEEARRCDSKRIEYLIRVANRTYRAQGPDCTDCGKQVSKRHRSVIEHPVDNRFVCRACKQVWRDAQ
ncbi:hypothetical protein ACFVWP_46910 [Streptomyces sp. NPDC058175]|uniref:hypothetical protein n=1 Tax=Streptomyces sp. NPDC058175 TaxID=3346367 RepID=UPI0036E42AEC